MVLRMNQPNTAHISLAPHSVPNVDVQFDDGRELTSGLANGEFGESDLNTHYMELSGDNIDDRITGGTVSGKLFIGQWGVDQLKFGVTRTERERPGDVLQSGHHERFSSRVGASLMR